jgi:hypothetical protein
MIIHHKEDFTQYQVTLLRPLKYSESFTFIPIKLFNGRYHKCILQTPLLFTPFGIQELPNRKKVMDISFINTSNDKSQHEFLRNLQGIYNSINRNYKSRHACNKFIKKTDYGECIRLKLSDKTSIFDESKNIVDEITRYTYGTFIIHLEGMWLNKGEIWFQWSLLQARMKIPFYLQKYSFIDDISEKNSIDEVVNNKYDRMLKLGVPQAAVDQQRRLDSVSISKGMPPPPPPPPPPQQRHTPKSVPRKINPSDLKSVVLKKNTQRKMNNKVKPEGFEPPTKEELQTTLSRLKSIK